MRFRNLHWRVSLTSILSKRCHFHVSAINLTVRKLPDNVIDRTTSGGRPVQGVIKVLLYTSGVGAVSASLYFFLVNGPSRSAPTSLNAPLSPAHFTPVTLTASIPCTRHTKLLVFSLPPHLIPDAAKCLSPIFSIYVKDSDIQIERPYTPLEGIDAQGRMHFWVKRYQGGEVGRWLHERKIGDQIEIRGPIRNWEWHEGEWDEVIMISGGTGITPFYQLLYSIFSPSSRKERPHTRFTLLHSSPTPMDLPPPSILDPLQAFAERYPESFSLRLHVDTINGKTSHRKLPKLIPGRIDREAVQYALGHRFARSGSWWKRLWTSYCVQDVMGMKILFLICGPEPMVAAIAGPRARDLTQGAVGGMLEEMGAQPHQVYKL